VRDSSIRFSGAGMRTCRSICQHLLARLLLGGAAVADQHLGQLRADR